MKENNIEIIYENEDFLVLNKGAGITVHRVENKEIEGPFLTDWLIKKYPEISTVGDNPKIRPGIVHRIDKDTSGILIIVKNQKSFEYFKKLFTEKKIKKTYLALVYGKIIGKGTIKKPIGIKSGSVKRTVSAKKMKMIKEAITEYRTLKIFQKGKFTLLEVSPLTGKTHQIRVHLASIGHPIVGDKLYGKKKDDIKIERQFLHAYSLEFDMPNGGRIKIEADLPEELQKIIEELTNQDKETQNLELSYDE